MNIAVPAAHRALDRAKVSAKDVDHRLAKSGAAGLVANQWRENVAFVQKHPASGANCFLAAAHINPAANATSAIEAGQFVFENARLQHPSKCFDVSRMRLALTGRRARALCFSFARGGLKHAQFYPTSPITRKKYFCFPDAPRGIGV